MIVNDEVRYRAVQSRDARFDGTFFTGVTTTGVYCRPICPAKTPNRRNVRFFACAAAAEAAGFRPCKRCRPETAPGTPVWNGTESTVTRAVRLINDGFLSERSMEELAETLGMGSRHLRRLFIRHLGVPPKSLDTIRRSHLAAILLTETSMPITSVAFDSGFRSLRQFNDAFRKSFGVAPSEARRRNPPESTGNSRGPAVELRLPYRPPFDWEALLEFLARRAIAGVESVTERVYRRSIPMVADLRAQDAHDRQPVNSLRSSAVMEVGNEPDENRLAVTVYGATGRLSEIVSRVRRMFDLAAEPQVIAEHLHAEPILRPVVERFPGIRIPGTWDPFEAAVRAVVGQQITVTSAVGLLGELTRLCGTPISESPNESMTHLFPTPSQVYGADLGGMGMPNARKRALKEVARAWIDGRVPLAGYRAPSDLTGVLGTLKGVGPWTAQYIALRGFFEPDSFLESDIGLRAALADLLGQDAAVAAPELHRIAERWRPWRGYAAILLWRNLAINREEKMQ